MYIVFFHHGLCVVLAYRIKVTSDLIHHLNDRDVCISVCEEFHNIKTYSTAAYDNDFFAFQIRWKIINVVDHTKNRINIIVLVVNTILQSCDRRQKRSGTGGTYDDIRMELANVLRCSFCICEDIKVLKLLCAVHEIVREISQTVLCRDF